MTATIAILEVIFVILGLTGAVAALFIYAATQPWWRTQIGRFLTTQAGIICVVYLQSVLRVIFQVRMPLWVPLGINIMVATLMLYHAWVFLSIVRRDRRRRRNLRTIEDAPDVA